MDLICYLHPGWEPLIRPSPATRGWMDDTPESFAYRCLPLNIANAHGWEILNPCAFEAVWNGEPGTDAITLRALDEAQAGRMAVSLFGQGIITFHVEGVIRTPPGWNLWVGGSPNRAKDAIAPLSGVVETDWSPFTFTMNWRFTRPGQWVRFEAMEPFAFVYPVRRGLLETVQPRFAPLAEDPDLARRFQDWTEARNAFQARVSRDPPKAPADRWQKHYYRGVDVAGEALIEDHCAKLRLAPFDRSAVPGLAAAPQDDVAVPASAPMPGPEAEISLALRKREWLLETLERQRDLAPSQIVIERREGLEAHEFLERYYAVNRPVILTGEMADWPALTRWTPDYLKAQVGDRVIEYQGGRDASAAFERDKDAHRRLAPFDAFIDRITGQGAGNDAYLTAYNAARNAEALAGLDADLGFLDRFLTREAERPNGLMWIGAEGSFTPLHHDLTNNFIAQVVGRKRIKLLPASEVGKLGNRTHVFSDVPDLEAPDLDLGRHPRLAEARIYEVLLEAGEILFMPLAWWHQVRALSFSVTLTYTNFLWPNDGYRAYPEG